MASEESMVEHICDQMQAAGDIKYRKMFGEYGIYLGAKFIGTICDNTLYLKVTAEAQDLEPHLELAPAYEGAKPSFRIPAEMLDDPGRLTKFAKAIYETLPNKKA